MTIRSILKISLLLSIIIGAMFTIPFIQNKIFESEIAKYDRGLSVCAEMVKQKYVNREYGDTSEPGRLSLSILSTEEKPEQSSGSDYKHYSITVRLHTYFGIGYKDETVDCETY